METKRIIIAFALSMLVLILWEQMVIKNRSLSGRREDSLALKDSREKVGQRKEAGEIPLATQRGERKESIIQDKDVKEITLGNLLDDKGYKVVCTFSTLGAALKEAILTEFAEDVRRPKEGYKLLSAVEYPDGKKKSSLTTIKVVVNEGRDELVFDLSGVNWFSQEIKDKDYEKVRFWVDIEKGDRRLLRIVKEFVLRKKSYDLEMVYRLEDVATSVDSVKLAYIGPIGIRKEDPRSDYRKVYFGIRSNDSHIVKVGGIKRTDIIKQTDFIYPIDPKGGQIIWAGQANKYFAAVLAVKDADTADNKTANEADIKERTIRGRVESVFARCFSAKKDLGEDLTTVWTIVFSGLKAKAEAYNASDVKGKDINIAFEIFLGPKSSSLFSSNKRYIERNYHGMIEYTWCTFQWLADLMIFLLTSLYKITHNYGLAIILLVLIVRVVLHPITKSSQLNMMRMQKQMKKMQPKLQAIREKYKNNREAMNRAIMELYREEGINPATQIMGCLPMLLQMPIWVALWSALNNTFELRHQGFILWIRDLAGPDSIVHFAKPVNIPIISFILGQIHDINILPILLVISMLLQQRFFSQPTADTMIDPEQARQQKFMFYFMGIFFGIILYNAPSGLNLYILTSNLLGIIESKRIRKHLELEEQGKISRKDSKKGKEGLFSLWERLQKRVEEISREYDEKQKEKKNR